MQHLLVMQATVYRRRTADPSDPDMDRFGQPYKTTRLRQPSRTEMPIGTYQCRMNAPGGGEQMQERSHDVVQQTSTVYFDRGADVREQDVLTVTSGGITIVDRAEVTLVKHVFDGTGTLHHLEVSVSVQRQSTGVTWEEASS
jgi:hypothetical protein